jgi:hypothetical protein
MEIVAISIASSSEAADTLYIYDGNSVISPLIRLFDFGLDASGPHPSFMSSQRYMLLRFVADKSVADTGFNLTFSSTTQGKPFTRL